MNLYSGGITRVRAVHSLVAVAFLGPRPPGHMVLHRDGDHSNCAADNLFYAPLSLRQPRDKRERGQYLVGKLSKEQAIEIRKRARNGESTRLLAEEFRISSALVSNIKHGTKWKA